MGRRINEIIQNQLKDFEYEILRKFVESHIQYDYIRDVGGSDLPKRLYGKASYLTLKTRAGAEIVCFYKPRLFKQRFKKRMRVQLQGNYLIYTDPFNRTEQVYNIIEDEFEEVV